MGGEVSTESDKSGWRVLQVMKNSPCGDKGLVTYFHVLTHVNGVRVTKAESLLFTLIQHGQPTKLSFVNFATGGRLEMEVIPNRNWGGDGLLGLRSSLTPYILQLPASRLGHSPSRHGKCGS